jgi:hypothetical protein
MKKIVLVLALLALLAASPAVRHMKITDADMESEFPSLAPAGKTLGVAWMDGRDGNQEVYFRTVDLDANQAGPEARLTDSADWDDNPDLAWTGSEFGISYVHEARSVFRLLFQRLAPDGRPLGPAKTVVTNLQLAKETRVLPTGNGYGLIYTRLSGGDGDLFYQYLDPDGAPQGEPAALTSGPGRKIAGTFLRADSDLALFFLDSARDAAYLLRLDALGKPKAPPLMLGDPAAKAGLPAAAFNGKFFLAVWPQTSAAATEVMAALIDQTGALQGQPYALSAGAAQRPGVAVAAASSGFGAAWFELTEAGRNIKFRRLDPEGKPIEGPWDLYSPRPVKIVGNAITMTADPTGFIVARSEITPPVNTEIVLTKVGF